MFYLKSIPLSISAIFLILNNHFGGCPSVGKLPPLGRAMREEFFFNADFVPLNHGSYGTYPKVVSKTLHEFQERSEHNPDLWFRKDVRKELDKVRGLLADLVSADAEDVVMVPNTTGGVNAVFRSLSFALGERILHLSTIYYSMDRVIQYLIDSSGDSISRLVFNVTYPMTNEVFLQQFEAFLNETEDPQKPIKIALVDHITSVPGVVIPVDKVIPMLRARGIQVFIDGAHAIGQVPINITALKPDYYVTNAHKWLYAARGCALLYVDKKHQGNVHPAHIASRYKNPSDFQNEFFWTGTMDYSSYMTVPTALQFRKDVGGEEVIMQYNHNLAYEGGHRIASLLGTEVLQTEEQIGSMVDVRLPVENPDDPRLDSAYWIDEQLNHYPNTFSPVYKHNGQFYVRVSAQIYNDITDFEFSARHFQAICDQINAWENTIAESNA